MSQQTGFFGEENRVHPDWVYRQAEQKAEVFMGTNPKKPNMTRTQLRKFYNEFLRIRDLPIPLQEKRVEIAMLRAKTAHKANNNKVPQAFDQFMKLLIDSILAVNEDSSLEKRFKGACDIMAAIVGFYKGRD